MSVAETKLDSFVDQTGELFSLPAVAVDVLELTSSVTADARQLKECIEKDPALTIKILRVVNSSLFGLSKQVSNLNQALALLGMKPLKLLVLGFSLPDALFTRLAGEVLGRYWQRTLVKSVAAREISQHFGGPYGDEAFIAGLLQDIGMLVLIQKLDQPYVRFLTKTHEQQGNLRQVERLAMGFDHVQLSARLLENWKLPKTIIDAVRGGEPAPGPDGDLARILDLADLVATLLCDGQVLALPELMRKPACQRIFAQSWLEDLIDSLQDKVNQLADVLSLELPQGTNYRAVLDCAHFEMVRLTSGVVGDLVRERATQNEREALLECGLDSESRVLASALEVSLTTKADRRSTPLFSPVRTEVAHAPCRSAATEKRTNSTAVVQDSDAMLAHVHAQVAACRQSRVPLSLMLVEIDRYDDVVFREGTVGAQLLFDRVAFACEEIDHEAAICVQVHDSRFAIILTDCDRPLATRLGNELVRSVRGYKTATGNGSHPAITLSVGVGTVTLPPRNFLSEDLIEKADRCLQGARLSGGDVLKSIEIY